MCTVSWFRTSATGYYELFCNRDERNTRRPASAPAVSRHNGVRYVAPADGDHGGSWIAVNEFGLALCLLNRDDDGRPAGRSRGLLLRDITESRAIAPALDRLTITDLAIYRPFTLLLLALRAPAVIFHWTGRERLHEIAGRRSSPLISSSFRAADVAGARRKTHARMTAEAGGGVTAEMLAAFHRSHEPERGPASVCMHRADAATVSFSHIRIGARAIEFSYQPGSPCAGAPFRRLIWPRSLSSPDRPTSHARSA